MANKDGQSLPDLCSEAVTAIFPDICPHYLGTIAAAFSYDPERVVGSIVQLLDTGRSYPKQESRKRKREDGDDEAAVLAARRKYDDPARLQQGNQAGAKRSLILCKTLIAGDFPYVPLKLIQKTLQQNNNLLFPSYLAIHQIYEKSKQGDNSWSMKATASRINAAYKPDLIDKTINSCKDNIEKLMLEELRAARTVRDSMMRDNEHAREAQAEDEARARGELVECQCCFSECQPDRVVCCDGEPRHVFCFDCGRRQAETLIGLSKYDIKCMSIDGCDSGFSFMERSKFLSRRLSEALDRIEADTAVRMADLEGLESCPFCPFAALCPDVKSDKEFRCENPECGIVSCRLCKDKTHLPQTCEQAKSDRGASGRKIIEEAMSEAIIRKCNKCETPFIKHSGCNKMVCTRANCNNMQCYVCSESCDYSHFNDTSRGGKRGNCPLFENVEDRHAHEIQQAEEVTQKRILSENPSVDPEHLKFKMSDVVKEDEKRRRLGNPHHFPVHPDELLVVDAPGLNEQDRDFLHEEAHRVALDVIRRRIVANFEPEDVTEDQRVLLRPAGGRINYRQHVEAIPHEAEAAVVHFFHQNFEVLLLDIGQEAMLRHILDVEEGDDIPVERQAQLQGVIEDRPAQRADFLRFERLVNHAPPFHGNRRRLRWTWRNEIRQVFQLGVDDWRRLRERPPLPSLLNARLRDIRQRAEIPRRPYARERAVPGQDIGRAAHDYGIEAHPNRPPLLFQPQGQQQAPLLDHQQHPGGAYQGGLGLRQPPGVVLPHDRAAPPPQAPAPNLGLFGGLWLDEVPRRPGNMPPERGFHEVMPRIHERHGAARHQDWVDQMPRPPPARGGVGHQRLPGLGLVPSVPRRQAQNRDRPGGVDAAADPPRNPHQPPAALKPSKNSPAGQQQAVASKGPAGGARGNTARPKDP